MLNGVLTLWDIRDVEAFTTPLIPPNTNPQDREDLHAYLIETCWELSLEYHPGGIRFSTYARNTLPRRIVDWHRQRHGRTTWKFTGRTHERKLPTIIPLDTLTETDGHPPTDRTPDLTRLLRTRGSDEAWRPHQSRTRLHDRAA